MAPLDDAAGNLNVGEKHAIQLMHDGRLIGWQRISQRHARHFQGLPGKPPKHVELKDCPPEVRKAAPGAYVVDGNSVLARRRALKKAGR